MTIDQDAINLSRLAASMRAAIEANPRATFAQAVEALALIASEYADGCRSGSLNETAWTNACGRLFDLAQGGRLYRDETK